MERLGLCLSWEVGMEAKAPLNYGTKSFKEMQKNIYKKRRRNKKIHLQT